MLKRHAKLMKEAGQDFAADEAITLAASVAFYTALSFPPLLLLTTTIGGFLGSSSENELVRFFERQVGPQATAVTETVMEEARRDNSSTVWRWTVGVGVLLFSASAVFAQLQRALNRIWDVEPLPGSGVWNVVRKRLISIGMIFAILFILLVALVVSSVLNQILPTGNTVVARLVTNAVSLGVFTVLFAATYKILPDVNIGWKHVWIGALVTAGLFTLGKAGISIYLQYGSVTRDYGQTAGALIAMLLWVFYSGIIFFFGAELTQRYAFDSGGKLRPTAHARWSDSAKREANRRLREPAES